MSESLGETELGAQWCLKALHPSDTVVQAPGVPDENCMSTVVLNYQTVHSITVPAGTGDGWQCDVQLTPHPIQFARYSTATSAGVGISNPSVPIFNSQLVAATHKARYDMLTDMASAWRLVYFGCTAALDAPALSNQGTVVVCQKPVKASYFQTGHATACARKIAVYNVDALPNYDVSQAMPAAYYSLAKEGAYVPLRLSRTSQNWTCPADGVVVSDDYAVGAWGQGIDDSEAFRIAGAAGAPTGQMSSSMFPTCTQPYWDGGVDAMAGDVSSPLLNDYVADLSFRGLSAAAGVKLFLRVGIEFLVPPASVLSAQLRMSPGYDPLAMSKYFQISRQLKDAYPEEYNEKNILWNIIRKVASAAAPMLSAVPSVGPLLSAGAGVLGALPDIGGSSSSARSPRPRRRAERAPRARARPPPAPRRTRRRAPPAPRRGRRAPQPFPVGSDMR